MAKGGVRPNSGRKSKAEELGLPNLIDDVIGKEGKKELIQKIYNQAISGKEASQKLLMEYIYGKPQIKVDLDGIVELTWREE